MIGENGAAAIRRANHLDVLYLRKLFLEYVTELHLDLGFQNFEEELKGLPGNYAPPRGEMLLAEVGDFPVGCVAMRPLAAEVCEMKRLYVYPSYRGKGLGKLLVEAIIASAQDAGYSAMRLDTLASMKAARSLYRAFGFRPIQAYCYNPLEGAEYMELGLRR